MAGTLCPLCNGLTDFNRKCPRCGSETEDRGQVEAFYDPYSPYEDDALIPTLKNTKAPENWCWHIAVCPKCNFQDSVPIAQLKAP